MYEVSKPQPEGPRPLTRRQVGGFLLALGILITLVAAIMAVPIVQRATERYEAVRVEVLRQGPDTIERSRRSLSHRRTVLVRPLEPHVTAETLPLLSDTAQPGQVITAWYAPAKGKLTERNLSGGKPVEWIIVGVGAALGLGTLVAGGVLRRRRPARA